MPRKIARQHALTDGFLPSKCSHQAKSIFHWHKIPHSAGYPYCGERQHCGKQQHCDERQQATQVIG
ncbi:MULTISPECIES: hypothetical protein [Yersinia pseudotuberculosis complex]|uniref:hypothetical protein n=1 Tax=Yersinia pseudotuberculosis complex TaxID=1649845 RepID=UPI00041B0AA6|nr:MULTISPECIES: hypothetical protein [Yersinia pseudotuberculosis complex]